MKVVSENLVGLKVGDTVEVECRLYRKRVLTVTAEPQMIGTNLYVWVSSGKVRPSHRSGGSIHLDDEGRLWYQPTMQQQICEVDGFAVVS